MQTNILIHKFLFEFGKTIKGDPMSMTYKKKPVEIEAMIFTGYN